MDLETLLSFDWKMMLPEFIILGAATAMTLFDLFAPKTFARRIIGWIGAAGILGAIFMLLTLIPASPASILYDTFYLDSFAKAFKLLLLVGGLLILVLALGDQSEAGMENYRGEYYYLLMAALLGGMIVTSSADLITLFIGLELLSISTYILVALRKKETASTEAGMKYVINGSIATAITLFGYSYLYGLSGTTNIHHMGETLVKLTGSSDAYLLLLALILIVAGLSFKLAAIPFHMWVPDVYHGAPTIVTAFLSVISKTAGFALFIRLMYGLFANLPDHSQHAENILAFFQPILIALAVISMLFGNIMAIRQQNIKRLFAYSSIAHAGYLLAGLAALTSLSIDAVWYYLLAYAFMNIGAFAVISYITEKEQSAQISHFAGLYQRSPLLAVSLSIFLLSLASIPGTAGFIGKIKIIMSALMADQALYIIVIFIIVATVISYFYYFGIMVQLFFRPAQTTAKLSVKLPHVTIITICAISTILLGISPIAANFFQDAFNGFSDFLK